MNDSAQQSVAVVLCGAGNMDGSEIHEATLTLAALAQAGYQYQCYALDRPQGQVSDYLTGRVVEGEIRNQKAEAARIARGDIQDLEKLRVEDHVAVIFPGGFGVAHNLCTFANDGAEATVEPAVVRVLQQFRAADKPIGLICISPVLAALVFGQSHAPQLTLGEVDTPPAKVCSELGARMIACSPVEWLVDEANKICTTPAYMSARSIAEVKIGIYGLVQSLKGLVST